MSSLDPPTPPLDPAFSQRKVPSGNCEVRNKEMAVTSLKRHMTTVHRMKLGKQIECQACGKLFQSKDRLDQHSKTHRLERGGQPFSCPKCNYKTGSKYYLTDHARRMHTQNISEPSPIQTAPAGACKGDLSGAGLQQIVSSQNSKETIQDTNLNPDDLDIDNIQFEICA